MLVGWRAHPRSLHKPKRRPDKRNKSLLVPFFASLNARRLNTAFPVNCCVKPRTRRRRYSQQASVRSIVGPPRSKSHLTRPCRTEYTKYVCHPKLRPSFYLLPTNVRGGKGGYVDRYNKEDNNLWTRAAGRTYFCSSHPCADRTVNSDRAAVQRMAWVS
jgi:hypothetical protein